MVKFEKNSTETFLDKKDRRILLALDMDARAPAAVIAKRVKLSKQVVTYRIRRLEKRGTIKSYHPVIDHVRLGLKFYRFAIKLEDVSPEVKKEILSYLFERSAWIVSVLGPWDIFFSVYVENDYELMAFWQAFYEKFGRHIKERWVALITRFWNFERSILLPELANRNKVFFHGKHPEPMTIDELDKRVLKELTKNARQTSLELSRKLKATERVVRYRIQKLEKDGVILGYRTALDTTKLGLRYYKLFIQMKNASAASFATIRTYIQQSPFVVYSTEAIGGFDFELEAHFPDSAALYTFMNELRERFPTLIKELSHMEYMEEHKVTFYPM
jgi:Lrp/AsnC family transcriptional regulator, leucine-responsive regulatory protein